ncbi:DNA cytosine methyltransferase [Mesorhizobium caraganae]|uniref:DNA cytosine methyltransferase n=1 Tax=Mesorhizobium caraganae TaxID=483206 RepID=UPI001AF02031|nr:DNA (cytosine-5-)-methyltransferase [Mesorhizobium caraganae]
MFSGCGGLALGLARAGFEHMLLVERDRHSVANVDHNVRRGIEHISHWQMHSNDVRAVNWRSFKGKAEFVAGGPPCQPFSIGGLHKGEEDSRDMWPEAVRAVRDIEPKAFLFENVRGLLRPKFSEHLDWIRLSLTNPELEQLPLEDRGKHLTRLRRAELAGAYEVAVVKVNAADYGAAQKRHRVLFLGVRRDIVQSVEPPKSTHSRERLLWDQWISGEYWKRHGIRKPEKGPSSADVRTVEQMRRSKDKPQGLPWRTVRDALAGLGNPSGKSDFENHTPQLGARSYPGHTGSPADEPSKALKAGVHGVPGGENTLALPDGSVRYFSVREAARLQGLPDDYHFVGSWSENMRQLGNAAPVQLAESFGRHLMGILERASKPQRHAA